MRAAVKEPLLLLSGAVLGVFATVLLQGPIERTVNGILDRYYPARRLERADKLRRRMTDTDLRAAGDQYKKLLEEGDVAQPLRLRIYQGLSRTYGDFCRLYHRRGLSRDDYASAAKEYADSAERELPGHVDTAIAAAYSTFCAEAESKQKPRTEEQVKELRRSHGDNFDVQYLAWLSGLDDDTLSFSTRLDAERNPPLMPLLDVGQRFVLDASGTADAARRAALWRRADSYFLKAEDHFPDNPLVYFNRGYRAQVSKDTASARDYYKKALEKEMNFPRARNNLGVTFALNGEWNEARLQFEAAAATPNAPAKALLFALGNLGEIYWEREDDLSKACSTWLRAHVLPGSAEDPPHLIHLALCAYPKDLAGCRQYYARAIHAGKEIHWDLTDVNVFETDWRLGPKELSTVRKVMKDCAPQADPKE